MYNRGNIVWADLPKIANSKIQEGLRPVLLVSNQRAIDNSPVFQYIPLTTKIKREDLPIHFVLTSGDTDETSMILGEQINSIDKNRLGKIIGTASESDMKEADMAIAVQLGLVSLYNNKSYPNNRTKINSGYNRYSNNNYSNASNVYNKQVQRV